MSSLFSRRQLRTNTPPVCKKPPKPLPPGPFPTPTWPLEVFASVKARFGTLPLLASAIIHLTPVPGTNTWTGQTTLDSRQLIADATYDPVNRTITLNLQLLLNGGVIGDWTVSNYPIPPAVPWCTRAIILAPPPPEVSAMVVIAT
jgi:hypothetical protein